ncbi:MAG TPA: hypothetical protein VIJ12_03505 [Candidatus Baltobacteraceae bacterium]
MNRRRFPMGWAIVVLSLVVLLLVYRFDFPYEVKHMGSAYTQCPTDIRMDLSIRYSKPPLVSEAYHMRDEDGVSTYSYVIVGTSGRVITITAPEQEILDVSYLAGKLDQDGARVVTGEPPAGDTSAKYTMTYYRREMYGAGDCRAGSRTVTFTDPHYWATTAGRQYRIDLGKGTPKSAGDLFRLQGTTIADPRYQAIVDDFRNFGSDEYRAKIAAAQARVRSGK